MLYDANSAIHSQTLQRVTPYNIMKHNLLWLRRNEFELASIYITPLGRAFMACCGLNEPLD